MKNYKKDYYNQPEFWNRDFSYLPGEQERIEEIKNTIPPDVKSVLDVGCGNGFFVNSLKAGKRQYKKLVGLDLSKEALKHVKTEKKLGNISNLPFKNNAFDLVTALEVLEHLSQEDFKKGISELQRVSKKYILITVPNEDDLERSLVMCPKCYCWFNPYFHMRSFNKNSLQNLFKKSNLIKMEEIGPTKKYRPLNRLLLALYRSWRKPLPPKTAICPQCGYQHKESLQGIKDNNRDDKSSSILSKPLLQLKSLAKIIWPSKKKKRWLLALYEKSYK